MQGAAIVREYLSIYENDLRALITHRIPLRDALRCYQLIDQGATDLMQVKGFGEKSFNKISAYVTVEGKTTLTGKVSSPRKPRKSSRQQPATTASK